MDELSSLCHRELASLPFDAKSCPGSGRSGLLHTVNYPAAGGADYPFPLGIDTE